MGANLEDGMANVGGHGCHVEMLIAHSMSIFTLSESSDPDPFCRRLYLDLER